MKMKRFRWMNIKNGRSLPTAAAPGDQQGIWADSRMTRRSALGAGAAAIAVSAASNLPGALASSDLSGTLTLQWNYGQLAGTPLMKKLYAQYRARQPHITIKDLPNPPGDIAALRAYITTHYLAGRMPDLFCPNNGVSPVFDGVPKGWWVPLDPYLDQPNPYIPGNKRWRDVILPDILAQGVFLDGKTYMFGSTASDNLVFYNRAIFWQRHADGHSLADRQGRPAGPGAGFSALLVRTNHRGAHRAGRLW